MSAPGKGVRAAIAAYASAGYSVLDAAWVARCCASGARLDPAPRDFLARPAAADLDRLRRDFEPVWGLPRRAALEPADVAAAAAHARAHRSGDHWFYADAAPERADVDATLASHGVAAPARLLRGVRAYADRSRSLNSGRSAGRRDPFYRYLDGPTRCLAARFELYGADVVGDVTDATLVVADAPRDVAVPVVSRRWLDACVAAKAVVAAAAHAPGAEPSNVPMTVDSDSDDGEFD